jgi:hypothetical protein
MGNNIVIFTSRESAEAKTGYFSVSSIMITWALSHKIYRYISEKDLITFSQVNQAKTSRNTYTLNFTLKHYEDSEKQRAYLSGKGALGYYKDTLKTKGYMLNDDYIDDEPMDRDLLAFKRLETRSPSLEQMYFWICRKYPRDILWVDCQTERPALPF